MAQQLLSIDLQPDLLTAVLLDEDKNREIVASAAIIVNGKGAEEVITEMVTTLNCANCRCIISLGASFFSFQNLTLPFSEKKAVEKILPLELENDMISSSADVVIDAMINSEENGTASVIAAMIERAVLDEYYTALTDKEIFPEAIALSGLATIAEIQKNGHPPEEFIFLDLRLETAALYLFSADRLQLVRPLIFKPFLFDSEQTIALTEDETTGHLTTHGVKHSAESFRELALSVKQTLASLPLLHAAEQIPIYIDGSVANAESASTWLDASFDTPCLICGRAGLLPLPPDLSEETEKHASFLTACLSLGLQEKNIKESFNFSKDEFSSKNDLSNYLQLGKIISIPLLAMVFLFLGYLVYDTSNLKQQRAKLVTDIHAVFRETLPDSKRIVDPVQQLQIAVKDAQFSSADGGGVTLPYTSLDILHELSSRIPKSIEIRLTRMIYEIDGLRLMGITDTFNTVDSMKKELEKSQLFTNVTISSANMNPKDNTVRFELKLSPGEALP